MFLLTDKSVTTAILSKQQPTQQNTTMTTEKHLIIGLQLIGHSLLRRKKKKKGNNSLSSSPVYLARLSVRKGGGRASLKTLYVLE